MPTFLWTSSAFKERPDTRANRSGISIPEAFLLSLVVAMFPLLRCSLAKDCRVKGEIARVMMVLQLYSEELFLFPFYELRYDVVYEKFSTSPFEKLISKQMKKWPVTLFAFSLLGEIKRHFSGGICIPFSAAHKTSGVERSLWASADCAEKYQNAQITSYYVVHDWRCYEQTASSPGNWERRSTGRWIGSWNSSMIQEWLP